MHPTDLEVPDAPAHPVEPAVGFVLEIGGQVAGFAERQVHALIEVLAGLPVARDDLVGHDGFQECAQVIPERPIVVGQFDAREVHLSAFGSREGMLQ